MYIHAIPIVSELFKEMVEGLSVAYPNGVLAGTAASPAAAS